MGRSRNGESQLSLLNNPTTDYFSDLCDSLGVDIECPAWPDNFGTSLLRWQQKSLHQPVSTLSLFSGLGGLDIAFHDAGFNIKTLLEIDERFVKTLRANSTKSGYFGQTDVLCMDVRDFDASDLEGSSRILVGAA
jgi:DNA (cytosine-5)-methyltransferase 1